ncbi:ThiF family adenylyltransferase [Nonomuraea fuscirosea]|uniref:ThiF family adenylyltransferase n=1 Tax=Nonomuraea fuscirosea TaxID=1291556 RepID=UPI00389A5F57
MGVGRFTLLDRDRVEPRNFARQYLYRWADVDARKVARAAERGARVRPRETIDTSIDGPQQLVELVGRRHTPVGHSSSTSPPVAR